MEVATDIQDKPYAYTVARIQEALLGMNLVEVEGKGKWDGKWYVHHLELKTSHISMLILGTPGGETSCYRLPAAAPSILVKAFEEWFRPENDTLPNQWRVFMPESGAVYLRCGTAEIPLGAVSSGSLERRILNELKAYLET